MNIHEYQAKKLFRSFGIPVPVGGVARTSEEVVQQAAKLRAGTLVVKAQIHAGGRGKAGGDTRNGCLAMFWLPVRQDRRDELSVPCSSKRDRTSNTSIMSQ